MNTAPTTAADIAASFEARAALYEELAPVCPVGAHVVRTADALFLADLEDGKIYARSLELAYTVDARQARALALQAQATWPGCVAVRKRAAYRADALKLRQMAAQIREHLQAV